jgi:hypothetical protein
MWKCGDVGKVQSHSPEESPKKDKKRVVDIFSTNRVYLFSFLFRSLHNAKARQMSKKKVFSFDF